MMNLNRAIRNCAIFAFYFSGFSKLRKMLLRHRHGILTRVVCFHWIGPEGAAGFEKKLKWLKKNYELVRLCDVLADHDGVNSRKTKLAITFDDGYEDMESVVLPIIERLGVPITLFLPSQVLALDEGGRLSFGKTNIGIDKPMLTLAQIGRLLASPLVDIESHTKTHCDCGSVSAETLTSELGESRSVLENQTNASVKQFAYPYGSLWNTSSTAIKVLEKCGYERAWTIIPGFNHCQSNRFMLHRDSLGPDMHGLLFKAWLSGAYDVIKNMRNKQSYVR